MGKTTIGYLPVRSDRDRQLADELSVEISLTQFSAYHRRFTSVPQITFCSSPEFHRCCQLLHDDPSSCFHLIFRVVI
ncbi:hypothetical protein HAX54_025724, partial [Datura stramonium]|nr:hypothetical protein [Datura stramonium]